MNQLKGFQPSEFPLGQSLFWMDGDKPSSTWDWLCRSWDEVKRNRMYAKLQQYKDQSHRPSWTTAFLVFNNCNDNKEMVNPFLGCPTAEEIIKSGGGQADEAELAKWRQRLEIGLIPGVNLVPCLYCGDDKATVQNYTFVNYFTPLAVQFMAPYSRAICICSEPPKNVNVQWQESVTLLVKNTLAFMGRSDIPVVTHLQGDQIMTQRPSNADGVLYQFRGSPATTHERSIDDVVSEAEWAIKSCPVPLGFFELSIWPEDVKIREMTRRIGGIPGCGMLPGPT